VVRVDLILELGSISLSWRFWLSVVIGVAASLLLFWALDGWFSAILMVGGAIFGIFWSTARRE
jgi:hypothetical protein